MYLRYYSNDNFDIKLRFSFFKDQIAWYVYLFLINMTNNFHFHLHFINH